MEYLISLLSVMGVNGILLFFIKRYFDKRDKREIQDMNRRTQLFQRIEISLETLRLLSYHRMRQETEWLINKGYATATERRILKEMYDNYKAHGWNGDMAANMEKIYDLPNEPAENKQ